MLVSRWSLFLFIGLSADVLARRGKRTSEPDGKSSTQDSVDEYLRGVCAERGTWSTLTRPCEILLTIDYQCLTGLDFDVDLGFECYSSRLRRVFGLLGLVAVVIVL